MSLPKVSIVIPSYKAEHFEQCLRSAVGQTYPNIEIIVSDNCPTEAIRDICARFPGVIYQRNSAIRCANLLAAFYSGKGELIKPLFDDDILHPFCIERMVAVTQSHPDVELVFSSSQVIDARNLRVETRRPYQESGRIGGLEMHRNMVLGMRNFVGEFSTILFRRDKLWQIAPNQLFSLGGHDCTNGLADLAAYINLVAGGAAFYIDEELSYFRRDPVLQSNSNPNANPNFGYCFSDYIDLLPASHRIDAITKDELLATQDQVQRVFESLRGVFTQIPPAYERYLAYVHNLKESTWP